MTSGYIAAASFAQRRLRFLDLLQPGRSGYAIPLVVDLSGPADPDALRRAIGAVIDRHDVLRACLPLVDGEPMLTVRDALALDVPLVEVAAGTRDAWLARLGGAVDRIAGQAFDLAQGPLVAAEIVRAGDRTGLVVVFHHTVADGGSLPIFLNDLITAYDAERSGGAPRWAELPLQYPDYADWEQEQFGDAGSPNLAEALRHWRAALHDVPPLLDLPLDRRRGATAPQGDGATVRLDLPGHVGRALAELAQRRGSTPFLAFLAVFFAVLHRWSGLSDLVVTMPVSKRSRPELAALIGLFVDTLPLRLSCEPETSFDSLLDAVHRAFLEGIRHRDVPFQQIVKAIGIERRSDVVPLMQVLFGSLEPLEALPAAVDGTRFTVIDEQLEQTAKADLSIVYRQTTARVELWCRYDPALFDRTTVENLLAWFGTLAAAVADAPARPVGDLPLIDESAGRALIGRFNQTRRPYPAERSVAAVFEEVAARHAERPAIDEEGGTVGYAALARQAGTLAAALAEAGVGPGDAVVLAVPLTGRFIALVLAILRLGAVYVPMDMAHPPAHRARLAVSVGARAVILPAVDAEDPDTAAADHGGARILSADGLDARAAELTPHPLHPTDGGATAYVMFTSGSTGVPKGVAVPHRAILRLVCGTDFASFGPDTRAAVYSNPSFDASTLEIWAPLLNGGTAVVVDRRSILDATELHRMLAKRSVTLFWITAGLFHEIAGIAPAAFSGRRLVITGGDVVNPGAVRAVLAAGAGSGLRLLNAYGPTENTTFSTVFDAAGLEPDSALVPIGRPIANSTLYILDRRGRPLPAGVIGEIHLGGDGVAAGYVGAPERTAAAFLADPYAGPLASPHAGKTDPRMYRTGDYGRWLPDGTVLFAGRVDEQVKVRGFRIEPNEIAAALTRHPALRAAHVAAPRQAGGERHLVAYVIPCTPPGPTAAELRSFLEPLLPPHMLPHAYVTVDSLALNLNGKLDRKALPPVEDHHYDRSGHSVAPRNDEERVLAAIWRDLLGLDTLSVTDNFFRVGGDSILAIRMAAQAADAGLPLKPTDVFQLQTIERLAKAAGAAIPRPGHASADRIHPAELVPAVPQADGAHPFVLASIVFTRPVGAMELGIVVQRLAERHEALRLRWTRDGEANRLEIASYVAALPIRTVEAPDLPDSGLDAWIADHAERIGRGLDPRTGVTIAATLVGRGNGGGNGGGGSGAGPVVVLALHRAVADERTLALIAAELETAIMTGHAALPVHDTEAGWGGWLDWLEGYAAAQAAGRGLAVLEGAALRAAAVPTLAPATDGPASPGRRAIAAERSLDPAVALALTDSVPQRLAVTPVDILAAALAAALPPTDARPVLIEAIDGQRRLPDGAPSVDNLAGNLDGVLPILAPTAPMPMAERLRAVKAARQAVAATAPVYRILGQTFELPAPVLGIAWSMASGTRGAVRLHSLPSFGPSVRGRLVVTAAGGRLRLAWAGDEPAGGVAALLDRVSLALAEIAALASCGTPALHTPEDFPLAGLDRAALDRIVDAVTDIEDIYPLSPMQEAMLVHSLAAIRSEVNFEQSCMVIHGRLDHEAFRHAWATVFDRHAVLRTSFHWRGLRRPLQVVHRAVPLPLSVDIWPAFDGDRLDAVLAADRARGFDLERAPLVRLTMIQVAEDEVYVVSSFQHLLVDGWCLGRLEREVRAAYESHRNRRPPLFDPPVPYRSYIAWLAQADVDDSRRFFAELLDTLPERCRLFAPATEPARSFTTARLTLDRQTSRALAAFARRRGLTLAATLHFAWAVWLGGRLGRDDVVFGTTVSGRPAGVPGVESIVGLFINNLPVRLRLDPDAQVGERIGAVHALLGRLQDHGYLSPTDVAEVAGAGNHPGSLFDTLVVIETLASGTSAWDGAAGLEVEAVQSRLKTAYDLTFVAIPGDSIVLSLVQPDDGRELEDGTAVLTSVAAILAALPERADGRLRALPRPPARPPGHRNAAEAAAPDGRALRFATRPRSTLEARIASVVEELCPVPAQRAGAPAAADLDTDFWRMGVASLELIQLATRLERRLERPVPISLLLEHRSVAALARAIEDGQSWKAVVPMTGPRPGAAADPFICVHPVAGDVSVFLDLARAMPAGLPFWAIQAPGLEDGQQPLDSVEALAEFNLEALAEMGQPRPRWLAGYSFGGIVAFAMARRLAARGTPPERVVIIDTPAPLERTSILAPDPDRAHAEWLVRMADVRARFQGVEPALALEAILARPARERFGFALETMRAARLVPPGVDAGWLERAHRTSLMQYAAYLAYTPAPVPDPTLRLALIRAATPRRSDLGEMENHQLAIPDLGWQAFTGEPVTIRRVTGDHVTMLGAATAPDVAAAILGILEPGHPGDG